MKKLAVGILSASLILGVGTVVFAQSNGYGNGTFNFGQMKPYMEKMHPDLTEKELKDMYEACHGTNGAMPSKTFQKMSTDNMDDMMGKF
ncbi:hypothetical protein [Bacillus sp. JJ1764]|uniref:hypothetical protein n=1 Tax=Bacillus sp. JJ1764 TaxID=3122964 RepID=UPI003F68B1D0